MMWRDAISAVRHELARYRRARGVQAIHLTINGITAGLRNSG
jgi:phosphoenolpyruvate carboxylase